MTSILYRFGDFRLDLAVRTLSRGDSTIPLSPKALDCMGYLLEHRERAVGRDELIAAVWGKIDITDNALGQAILQARRALRNKDGTLLDAIRTVPRFGYHWQVPVTVCEMPIDGTVEVSDPAPAADMANVSIATSRTRDELKAASVSRRAWYAAAVIALVITAGIWLFMPRADVLMQRTTLPEEVGTASDGVVLPANIDADISFGWARLGIMDLVASRLRRTGQSIVPSDNVVSLMQRLQGDASDADRMAALVEWTRAAFVVSIDVRKEAEGWHVALVARSSTQQPTLSASGQSTDMLEAAAQAADHLAEAFGLRPLPANAHSDEERSFSGLLSKVEAAVLSGRLTEARALLAAAPAQERERPEARYQMAQIQFHLGEVETAGEMFHALLAEIPEHPPILRARVHNGLANLAYLRRDNNAVLRHSGDAVRLLADVNAPGELGRAWIGMASGHSALRHYDEALAAYAKARVALSQAGDHLALARVDAYQGLLDVSRGRPADAPPFLETAAERLRLFDAVIEELHTRVGLVYARLALLQPAEALKQDRRLAELSERVGDPRRKHYATYARAASLAANGRLAAAQSLIDALRDSYDATPDAFMDQTSIELALLAGQLSLSAGNARLARTEAERALVLAGKEDDPVKQASAYLLAWQSAEGSREATTMANDAKNWGAKIVHPAAHIRLALIAALNAADAGDDAVARVWFEQALTTGESYRVPADLLIAADAYARYLIERGDAAQAGTVAGRVAGWAQNDFDATLLQVVLHHALGQNQAWADALQQARQLAGERQIPVALLTPPSAQVIANRP